MDRFDSAMEGLRQHLNTKEDERKTEMETFQKTMESFVKEKTSALETSVKLIQNLNGEAIVAIKNIQEMKGDEAVPSSVAGLTDAMSSLAQSGSSSSSAFG